MFQFLWLILKTGHGWKHFHPRVNVKRRQRPFKTVHNWTGYGKNGDNVGFWTYLHHFSTVGHVAGLFLMLIHGWKRFHPRLVNSSADGIDTYIHGCVCCGNMIWDIGHVNSRAWFGAVLNKKYPRRASFRTKNQTKTHSLSRNQPDEGVQEMKSHSELSWDRTSIIRYYDRCSTTWAISA